ncbi:MFS transporter [Alteromonas sp. AMM-1]|uniref:MFS transporter n=1 Tax=Alteromonas sp. AMM-1 TaxID=3394233 RepID=UPI0039A42A99
MQSHQPSLDTPVDEQPETLQPAYWSGVFAMSLCVFALIASEFMPVSLLTPIASAFTVSEGLVGQGIAISGALAVITSLFIPVIAGGLDRKYLLLGMTALMGVSGAVIALSGNYFTYMLGRALIGVVVGGFWSMSAAAAMRLVSAHKVPRALAIFNGGNALALIVAAPLGAYLGAVMGWRGAFFCLVPLSVIAFAWQWRSLPLMPAEPSAHKGNPALQVIGLLSRRHVFIGSLAVGTFFMGQFVLYTYLRPFLESALGASVQTISTILLIMGAAGFVGTSLVNRVLAKSVNNTLVVIPVLMALVAVLIISMQGAFIPVVILLAIWGFIATAAPVGWWAWLTHNLPNDAEAGGGLLVAVIQLSIALGSTLGGLLFDMSGYVPTFAVSAAILTVAAALAYAAARSLKRAI